MNRTIVLVATALLAFGCARHQIPTRDEAAQLLRKIPQFDSAYVTRTFGLYRGRCVSRLGLDEAENKRYEAIANLAQASGWFSVEKRKATEKECGLFLAASSDVIAIQLTADGQKLLPEWPARPVNDFNSQIAMQEGGQRGSDWNLPLQFRRFGDVMGIADPDASTGEVPVEFRWELVETFGGKTEPNRGVARFRHYDTGWRIERVEGLEVK